MKAEDMFLDLGYDMYRDPYTLECWNDKRDDWICISFNLWDKILVWGSGESTLYIDMETFRAILEQMKELKWLEGVEDATLSSLGYERVDLNTFVHYQRIDNDKMEVIDFIPHSRTFTCEKDLKPMVLNPKLFKAILNEIKELGWANDQDEQENA